MDEAFRELKREIERALLLMERLWAACAGAPELQGLVRKLVRQTERTDSLMAGSGVAEACAKCARATGSCCFREMGESYGAMQLFANLLLGAEIPRSWDFPKSCYFVGKNGCELKSRHSFCLNYFCPQLIDILGEEKILEIQRQVGEQLLAGWELERTLTRFITSRATPEHP